MASHPHFIWKDLFRAETPEKRSILDTLRENILFRTLNRRELAYLSNFVYERVYQIDEPVFQQNDRGHRHVHHLQGPRGDPDADARKANCSSPCSRRAASSARSRSSSPDNIRTATAVPLERTVLIGFFKPELMEILERKPDMGVKILFQLCTVLGRRLIETTERITMMRRKQARSGSNR